MNGVMIKMRERVVAAHNDEGGAILILALAGVLIIFMTFLVMYDAGESAREKVEVQVGSDMAALSHATVKARSMNMIAYANVTKRVFYGYSTIYTAAYLALVEATAYYLFKAVQHAKDAVSTAKWCVTLIGCLALPRAVQQAASAIEHLVVGLKGLLQIIQETTEGLKASNFNRLYGLGDGGIQHGRSIKEVAALDTYQKYLNGLAPWWGWGEAATRGIRNGATLVGTWPAPAGSYTRVRNKVNFVFSAINAAGPGSIGAPWTTDEDGLPIEKPPEIASLGAFLGGATSRFAGHVGMCISQFTSPEFWGVQYYWDHWDKSEGYWKNETEPGTLDLESQSPKSLVTKLELLQLPIGCVMASATMGNEAIPYEIKVSNSDPPGSASASDGWWKASSNIAIGYKKGQGRLNKDSGRRRKFGYMNQEYSLSANGMAFKNEGYWSISRAEMVYAPGLVGGLANQLLGNANSVGNGINGMTDRFLNVLNEPTTWEPQWTSKMRPVNMPGEELADMSAIAFDTLPYMVLSAPLAVAYNDGGSFESFSVPSITSIANAAQGFIMDAFFLWRAGKGFSKSRLDGGALDK